MDSINWISDEKVQVCYDMEFIYLIADTHLSEKQTIDSPYKWDISSRFNDDEKECVIVGTNNPKMKHVPKLSEDFCNMCYSEFGSFVRYVNIQFNVTRRYSGISSIPILDENGCLEIKQLDNKWESILDHLCEDTDIPSINLAPINYVIGWLNQNYKIPERIK